MSELEANPESIKEFQGLAFLEVSLGDHIASGKILGNLIKAKLGDQLQELANQGMPMIGICNGFQILVKMGLLPQLNGEVTQEASLVHNNSAKIRRPLDRSSGTKISSREKSFGLQASIPYNALLGMARENSFSPMKKI